jgi:hypothetical protein
VINVLSVRFERRRITRANGLNAQSIEIELSRAAAARNVQWYA